jgi:amino acid adenylation domain-containing protein
MNSSVALHQSFARAAERFPDNVAVVEPAGGKIAYQALDLLANRIRNRLWTLGVRPGDRVGIFMRKSIDAVAAIFGILRTGAAYVPVDPGAPPARGAYILHNCSVKCLISEGRYAVKLRDEIGKLGDLPAFIIVGTAGGGLGIQAALDDLDASTPAANVPTVATSGSDLAYILYTSGSTGMPKGVMLSHDNAVSFVDWCTETFEPSSNDRFSSHAPFHFDLSILDIHVSLKHGASLVLIGEDLGKDPVRLAEAIADSRITCWYSAPSILSLLIQHGDLEKRDYSSLRLVLFAGEVFPVKHLRALTRAVPRPRYFNLYGPTETNVCTFYEVTLPISDTRAAPLPIGKVCSHLSGRVVDEQGDDVVRGSEGELCIAGRGVMMGYWGLPEQTQRGFLQNGGRRWYRTGDIVTEAPDGNFTYLGRRDRMVKRRGYRVELGEIEAGLYAHPLIKEAAVIARSDEDAGVKIHAFVSSESGEKLSLIEMKRHCSERLPLYMIPDQFIWCGALPKTSTDKVDYQRLKEMA